MESPRRITPPSRTRHSMPRRPQSSFGRIFLLNRRMNLRLGS